ALETIDRRGAAVSRTFIIQLEAAVLRRLNVSADDVLSALQKRFPKAKSRPAKDNAIETAIPDAGVSDIRTELEGLLISERQGQEVFLRDVAALEEKGGKAKKK